MELCNQTLINGRIAKVYPLKYTVNQLPIASFLLEHLGWQIEAGSSREVKCRLYCVFVDAKALLTADLAEDCYVEVIGFLSQNAKTQLVLHVTQLKFLDKGL